MWEAFRHVVNSKIDSSCKKFGVRENENADLADPKKAFVQLKLFFFLIKHGEVCDIFKCFLNMLINHKINEAKSGTKKSLSSCAKGLFAVRIQLLGNLCSYSLVIEWWENALLFDNIVTINSTDVAQLLYAVTAVILPDRLMCKCTYKALYSLCWCCDLLCHILVFSDVASLPKLLIFLW